MCLCTSHVSIMCSCHVCVPIPYPWLHCMSAIPSHTRVPTTSPVCAHVPSVPPCPHHTPLSPCPACSCYVHIPITHLYPGCMSVPAVNPHDHVSPHCMSVSPSHVCVHTTRSCPFCTFASLLHVYVPAAHPSKSLLHVCVPVAYPCPCCASTSPPHSCDPMAPPSPYCTLLSPSAPHLCGTSPPPHAPSALAPQRPSLPLEGSDGPRGSLPRMGAVTHVPALTWVPTPTSLWAAGGGRAGGTASP